VFERRSIEPEMAGVLKKLSGVWVQCSMNRDVLRDAGVTDNVGLIKYPYFDENPLLKLESPKEVKTFLYVGRFEPRKSPENVLRAFMRAFRPGEAKLILKLSPLVWTFSFEIMSPEAVIIYELVEPDVVKNGWTVSNWRDSIQLVRGKLSMEDMTRLYASADAYVSSSRGEGLDLPCFASKLAGRRVLTTASGGPEDFVGDGDIVVPATGRVDAHPRYDWGDGAWYIDYQLDDLIAGMQALRSRPVGNGRDWPMQEHRAERIGRELKVFFEQCIERRREAA
jgi:glycosyltransferase involved in cell wall biosynthesis